MGSNNSKLAMPPPSPTESRQESRPSSALRRGDREQTGEQSSSRTSSYSKREDQHERDQLGIHWREASYERHAPMQYRSQQLPESHSQSIYSSNPEGLQSFSQQGRDYLEARTRRMAPRPKESLPGSDGDATADSATYGKTSDYGAAPPRPKRSHRRRRVRSVPSEPQDAARAQHRMSGERNAANENVHPRTQTIIRDGREFQQIIPEDRNPPGLSTAALSCIQRPGRGHSRSFSENDPDLSHLGYRQHTSPEERIMIMRDLERREQQVDRELAALDAREARQRQRETLEFYEQHYRRRSQPSPLRARSRSEIDTARGSALEQSTFTRQGRRVGSIEARPGERTRSIYSQPPRRPSRAHRHPYPRPRSSTRMSSRRSSVDIDHPADEDGSFDDNASCSSVQTAYRVSFHEPSASVQTRGDQATAPPSQTYPTFHQLRQQMIREKGRQWALGLDPRDEVRFETVPTGFGAATARVRRRNADGEFQHPRRGSTPSYWELLSTVPIESGRLISRDPPARESPSASFRRNTTQLPINRYKPRPIGLDGADDEDEEPPQDFYNQIAEHPEDLAELLAEDPWLDGSFARDDNPRRHTPQEASHMPSSTSINRQAPNPSGSQQGQQGSQSQQQQTVNGLGGTHPGGLPSSVPHAGHQTDINYLWGVVQELSDILSQNRAQQANMISNIEQLHIRQREDEGGNEAEQPADGESSASPANQANQYTEVAALQSRVHSLQTQLSSAQNEVNECQSLVIDYETTLANLMDKLRSYAYDHATTIVDTHKHYAGLIEKEREANLQLRLEHGEWQAGLGRATEWARRALRARGEEIAPMQRRMREVKAENRVLRRLVGWSVEPDSDDEGDEERKRAAAMLAKGSDPGVVTSGASDGKRGVLQGVDAGTALDGKDMPTK